MLTVYSELESKVAEECGFDSPAYSAKKFEKFYLYTPKAYRLTHQAVRLSDIAVPFHHLNLTAVLST